MGKASQAVQNQEDDLLSFDSSLHQSVGKANRGHEAGLGFVRNGESSPR
jgi:hypothetical protein